MSRWKIVAAAAALAVAAGAGAAFSPVAAAQARADRPVRSGVLDIVGSGSRIGVSIRDVDDAKEKGAEARAGVVVDEVSEGSAAEKAGIRTGDLIVEFDGERVRSARQLTRLVQETPSGRIVQATIVRDGQRSTVSVTPQAGSMVAFERLEDLAEMGRQFRYRIAPPPPAPPRPPDGRPVPPPPPAPPDVWNFDEFVGGSASRLGVTVSPLAPQLAEYFGVKDGVLVSSVRDDSAAARAGLKAGDVITSVNGSSVGSPAELRRRVQQLEDGQEFTLQVTRDRKGQTLKGKAERAERRRTTRTLL